MPILQPDFNDPITLQVMWDRLVFIADQADTALGRKAIAAWPNGSCKADMAIDGFETEVKLCVSVSPTIEVPLALCASDHLPLSEPAQVVKGILLELVRGLDLGSGLHTVH